MRSDGLPVCPRCRGRSGAWLAGAVRHAVIRIDADRVELSVSTTAVDLGGIGVGYGLDCAARVLRDRGVRAALLEVRGDFIALGRPPGMAG